MKAAKGKVRRPDGFNGPKGWKTPEILGRRLTVWNMEKKKYAHKKGGRDYLRVGGMFFFVFFLE